MARDPPPPEPHRSFANALCVPLLAPQARLTSIKDSLDARDTGRGDSPEVAVAKARLNEIKTKSRMLQQEKRNIYDQISAADDLKKQQQDLTQRLKSQLSLFSVDEIERRIKALELQQQTTSLSVKEDKKMMEEIKRLSANKPMIRQYDEAQESLKGVRDHHNTLYAQLKAKNAELGGVKEEEEKCKEALEGVKSKDEAKRSDIPALFKERDGLRKEIIDHRDTIRKLRDEFNDRRREWQTFLRQQKEVKEKEWRERKAARQAEYDAQKKAYEEEQAKRDPWEEEKLICDQLISFVEKLMPKKDEAKAEAKAVEHPDGQKPLTKGDDDVDPYANLVKKKSKRKGGGGAAAAGPGAPLVRQKSMRLSHSPEDFALWEKLGFKAPSTTDDCPALLELLLAKREWLKTAPPKEKKKPPPAPKANGLAAAEEAEEAGAGAADVSDPLPNGAAAVPEMIRMKATSDSTVAIRLVL